MKEVFFRVPKSPKEDYSNTKKILNYIQSKKTDQVFYTFNIFPETLLFFYRNLLEIYPKRNGIYMEIVGKSYDRVSVLNLRDAVEFLGCGIVIDDFGLDKVSFAVSSILPCIVCVKFDGKYWKNPQNSLSVEGYVTGFKSEGITVVAEEVETEDDFKKAIDLGFDNFQGFYFLRERFLQWQEGTG
ncbi:EAL domain-containing protein [Persephonella sp. KM09-Lau-8]|uniref:EAL domain-containing protein n=1 Tax=Persephonella sp. KM09-Lau-8 TaxID=1158345 RepID=UPI0018CC101A|nr:EAL domain-containing protein [Persephonella sp. KM09-Lau-8]